MMNFLENSSSPPINRNLPIPLYFQLKDVLLAPIQEGQYQEGDPIPTEREIGEKFQVSRITVRRAIDELVREGYLITRRGRGTFVARPKIQRPLTRMQSFSIATTAGGHRPGSRLLSLQREKAIGHAATVFNLTKDDWIWIVERLRLVDDEPIGLSIIYLNLPAAVALVPAELEEHISLWSVLEEKGLTLSKSEETIEAVAANESQAQLLQVAIGSPLLLVEGIVYTDQAVPIEYHKMFNRGDRYKYTIQAVR